MFGVSISLGAALLLERQAELAALRSAVDRAAAGRGSTMLVSGEAGIGKTSLVRKFLADLGGRASVLAGACEDLLTPRALGPLRDAARSTPGPLAVALTGPADPDAVFGAVHEELADPRQPTVLVVDDAHWADGATLDVLRYVGRRIHDLPAVLVLTYRDDEIGRDHPLRSVLGVLGGPTAHRLQLRRLTAESVTALAADSPVDAATLHRLTGGNPFFVTEALAVPNVAVPATVVDAVLARVRRLGPDAQAALDQLAVVPARVELTLLRALLADLAPIAEAERAGVLEMRPDSAAFRHELARRAVVASIPASVRMELNGRVLRALLAASTPDLARVLHHAVEAGDDDAVVTYGPAAAKEASLAGAYLQAATCCDQVLRRGNMLPLARRAILTETHAWALNNLNRPAEATGAAEAAVRLWTEAGDERRLSHGLVNLSRLHWTAGWTVAAMESAQQALALLQSDGESVGYAFAWMNLGGLLVLLDREDEGLPLLVEALALAERLGATDLVALGRSYLGLARLQLGDPGGVAEVLRSAELAREIGNHEYVMRGFRNIVGGLWRLGRYAEAMGYLDQAESYGGDRDFQLYFYVFDARRYQLLAERGAWAEAEAGLRGLLERGGDPGMIGRHTLPILTRLLVRQGRDDAGPALARAAGHAARADTLEWLMPTGLAHIEHAWLTGRPEPAGGYPELLTERSDRPGTEHWRGELLRYLRRLGHPVEAFPGCPECYAAGLRGDWRAAAGEWERLGNPYARALELAESGEAEPTLEALAVFERLGAAPAVAIVRRRLRELGVRRRPRAPLPSTLANAAGLTARQVEILRLVAAGLPNAEIAQRLVISTRTVDHHVSAVLQKLGIRSRREAAKSLAELDAQRPE